MNCIYCKTVEFINKMFNKQAIARYTLNVPTKTRLAIYLKLKNYTLSFVIKRKRSKTLCFTEDYDKGTKSGFTNYHALQKIAQKY